MQDNIQALLESHPAWQFNGNQLAGEWKFSDFSALRLVVKQLFDLAEELNHHPTVTYGYDTLRIVTTTHDAGNVVTDLDLQLAKSVNALVE